jgi:hypothetical protein
MIAKHRHVLTPEVLYALLEASPFRYELMRIMAKFYRRAVDQDSSIPLAVWGSGCQMWNHPEHGELFDVLICLEYSGDIFTARWWCHNGRKAFTVDDSGDLVATAQAQAEWKTLKRYLPFRHSQALVLYPDRAPTIQGTRNSCHA